MDVINATGRRKTAVARVYMKKGEGRIMVNKKTGKDYFSTPDLLQKINQPFEVTNNLGKFDIYANLDGGGISGQAEALRLAISKALLIADAEYRPILKANGWLTRDPRMVERKKPGYKKARKRYQYSKR